MMSAKKVKQQQHTFGAKQQQQQHYEDTSGRDCKSIASSIVSALGRKKPLDGRTETNLNRCLNLLDLTTLGVGSTLGLGLYVLAGQVASNKAGPAVVLSFGLAALASAFSALCYAEFAGRVPRAGSAYAYSYITVGEFVAFIIGWNLILEYVIGASSVARGFSGYLRFVYELIIANNEQRNVTTKIAFNLTTITTLETTNLQDQQLKQQQQQHFNISTNLTNSLAYLSSNQSTSLLTASQLFSTPETTSGSATYVESICDYIIKYFDWPSVAIIVVVTAFILVGVKESANVTLLFTGVNIIVVMTVVVSSISSLDLHNWRLTKEELPAGGNYGEGGFMPFGWSGVLAGSATCFFGFIGFDTIASSAEEANNPKRNVPLSITLSLFISFIAYMAIAIVQTLLWPYYDQDKVTILPYIFERLGMTATYWIVLLGAIAGLASSQLGGMYPLPRILYSMAKDKLIYAPLAHINHRLKLPVRATILGSVFVATLACLLDIQDLADMVSIGTLAAYSLVSLSVLIVRYDDNTRQVLDDNDIDDDKLATTIKCELCGCNEQLELITEPNGHHHLCGTGKAIAPNRAQESEIRDVHLSTYQADNIKLGKQPKWTNLLIHSNSSPDADCNSMSKPNKVSSQQSRVLITLIVVLTILLNIIALGFTSADIMQSGGIKEQQHIIVKLLIGQQYLNAKFVLISGASLVAVILLVVVFMLSRLPTSSPAHPDMFLVPFVPLIPTLSILVNTFLMLNLSYLTWVRFGVWMAVGLFIYFTYGIWNSVGYMLHMN